MSAGDVQEDSSGATVKIAALAVAALAVVGVATALAVVGWLLGFGFLAAVPVVVAATVALPLVALVGYRIWEGGGDETPDEAPDPLAQLRERYARGEIDEAEFERRVERLLDTEDGARRGTGRDGDREVELE